MQSLWRHAARRAEFMRGVKDMLPAFPGILAWGLVTGVAMVKGGLGVPFGLTLSLLAYAGSAQLASVPLIASNTPVWVIGVTALMTNMRFVIYAATLRHWLAAYRLRWRAVLGYVTGDISFVLFMNRIGREGAFPERDAWLFGMSIANWFAWQVSSIAGIVAASIVPTAWGLQFAGTLALLGLVVPLCRRRAGLAGAVAAGLVALAGHDWPFKTGLLAGVLAGITVATAVEGRDVAR